MSTPDLLTVTEAAAQLGAGVSLANVYARIKRGSVTAVVLDNQTYILQAEVNRLIAELEPCADCQQPATSYVIVKYHHHERLHFSLCQRHAATAQMAYSRQGGVIEVVAFPILGEGWLKP